MSAEQVFDAEATLDVDDKKLSMLYTVLPAMLQERIPSLPSIRRALSDMRTTSRPFDISRTTSEAMLPRSPPPGYTSRPGSAVVSRHGSNRSSIDTTREDGELFREALSETTAGTGTPPPFAVSESRTGIKWKYANQGSYASRSTKPDDD